MGSPEEDLSKFAERLKSDQRFFYSTGVHYFNEYQASHLTLFVIPISGDEIVAEYKRILKEAEAKLSSFFGILPKAPYDVRYDVHLQSFSFKKNLKPSSTIEPTGQLNRSVNVTLLLLIITLLHRQHQYVLMIP